MNSRSWVMAVAASLLVAAIATTSGCTSTTKNTGTGQTNQGNQNPPQVTSLRVELVEQWLTSGHSKIVSFAAAESGCKNCHDGAT